MIYISGKMKGLPGNNYKKFDEVENELLNKGFTVVNPANIARGISIPKYMKGDEESIYDLYLKEDLKNLEKCDSIYLIKGWQFSNGAKIELKRAIELGLTIILEE